MNKQVIIVADAIGDVRRCEYWARFFRTKSYLAALARLRVDAMVLADEYKNQILHDGVKFGILRTAMDMLSEE